MQPIENPMKSCHDTYRRKSCDIVFDRNTLIELRLGKGVASYIQCDRPATLNVIRDQNKGPIESISNENLHVLVDSDSSK